MGQMSKPSRLSCRIVIENGQVQFFDEDWNEVPEILVRLIVLSVSELFKPTYVYLGQSWEKRDEYKIGISYKPHRRATQLDFRPLHYMKAKSRSIARFTERTLHGMFASKRLHGEWFALSQADVNAICEIRDVQHFVDAFHQRSNREGLSLFDPLRNSRSNV
jgi:hypothetical protein